MQALLWTLWCIAITSAVVGVYSSLDSDPSRGRYFGPLQRRAHPEALEAISLSSDLGNRGFRIFVDEHGRERIFKGVNVVVKGPPWMPSINGFDSNTSLVAEDFILLRSLGVNIIRLGVMWPGVEPERGVYNLTYLAAMKDLAAQAAEYGIYTLVDMHQDVVSV
jgi:hypothetical protein